MTDSLPTARVGSYITMDDAEDHVCGHRWEASRVEVETLPVLHVCMELARGHVEHVLVPGWGTGLPRPVPQHRCACGATAPPGPPPPPPGRWPGPPPGA